MSDTTKPSRAEEEYFARENAEKLRKLAHEKAMAMEEERKAELKRLHWMRCPKCGMELQTIRFRGIEIDRCFNCGVTVFDEGELEKIGVSESERPESVMRSILNIFKR
ncbi:MAG: zf-TFIIB domain-containing protein [Pseudomonadota bacterium]|nr:MAG: hypothetical protein DIU72_09920 [Pseudomonadota bacterium]